MKGSSTKRAVFMDGRQKNNGSSTIQADIVDDQMATMI